MAKISKPPIPMKMYRHFAIITVALTALLALLADGESQEAVVNHVEAQQQQAELQRISNEKTQRGQLTMRDGIPPTSFDPGDNDNFGNPSMQLASSNSSIPMGNGTPQSAGMRALPGYSSEYLNSLTPEQYQKLIEQLRKDRMLSAEEREQTLQNLTRQSAARSGEATTAEN